MVTKFLTLFTPFSRLHPSIVWIKLSMTCTDIGLIGYSVLRPHIYLSCLKKNGMYNELLTEWSIQRESNVLTLFELPPFVHYCITQHRGDYSNSVVYPRARLTLTSVCLAVQSLHFILVFSFVCSF